MNITMTSIANELGVSDATVSRALSNNPKISTETRARVLRIAAEKGYRNPRLRTSHPQQKEQERLLHVGVLIACHGMSRGVSDPIATLYLSGMSEAAQKLNASLHVHYVSNENHEWFLHPESQPPAMREGLLDGVVLVHHFSDEAVQYFSSVALPCVLVAHGSPLAQADFVDVDEINGMALAVQRLYDLGHRKIGFAGERTQYQWALARQSGYEQALVRLGLPRDPAWIEPFAEDEDAIRAQAERVVKAYELGVTAWVCANDGVGHKLQHQLDLHGIRVPEQISLIGVDAEGSRNADAGISITSIQPPFTDMGVQAVQRLIARMQDPVRPWVRTQLACSLFHGKTTAAPQEKQK